MCRRFIALGVVLAVAYPVRLLALHGLNPVAYGARQAGMAGAFSAIGGSVLDLEGNPAHLGRAGGLAEAGLSVSFARLEYDDRYLDPVDGAAYWTGNQTNVVAPFPWAGLIGGDADFGWGLAVYTRAAGGVFQDLPRRYAADRALTARGRNQLAYEDVAFRLFQVRLSSGVAGGWGRLRLGATADIIHARNTLDRESRDASGSFVLPGGLHYRSDPSLTFGGKIGLTYELSRHWRAGLAYTPMTVLHLDGALRTDGDDLQFYETRVSRRMRWPARTTAGLAFESGDWSFGFDVRYYQWQSALRNMRFDLEDPRVVTPVGVAVNSFAMRLHWRDQIVPAVGVERRFDGFALRCGYSYGATPITPEGVTPFLGATTEHHVSAGAGIRSGDTDWNVALEYAFPRRVTASRTSDWSLSRQLVFADGTVRPALFEHSRSTRVISVYLGMVYRWDSKRTES